MEQLDCVEDRLAIQELNQRYATHIDLHEIDEWVGLFTQDAVFDEREFGSPLSTGQEEIRAYGQTLVETVQYALHHMTTHVISGLTATSARGIAFSIVEYLLKDGFRARTQVIYQDRYEKVDGRWLIAERILKQTIPTEIINEKSQSPVV
jgi:hypothetical protein